MTLEATFIGQLEDGTATYHVTLNDPAHQEKPLVIEVVMFENEVCLAQTLNSEDEN